MTPASRALPSVWTTPLAAVARVPVAAASLKIVERVTNVSVSFNATNIHVGYHVDAVLKVLLVWVCVCVCMCVRARVRLYVCVCACVCVINAFFETKQFITHKAIYCTYLTVPHRARFLARTN